MIMISKIFLREVDPNKNAAGPNGLPYARYGLTYQIVPTRKPKTIVNNKYEVLTFFFLK